MILGAGRLGIPGVTLLLAFAKAQPPSNRIVLATTTIWDDLAARMGNAIWVSFACCWKPGGCGPFSRNLLLYRATH
jgi:hypothetical protein